MANQFDLAPRLAALQAAGLRTTVNLQEASAQWLLALVDCDLRVVNVKGVAADETICLIRLKDLEQLMAHGEPQPNADGDSTKGATL